MKLTYPTFASPLLWLLFLALEATGATSIPSSISSTCSSAGNNQICSKSPPEPSHVGIITPPPAHSPQLVSHCNPLPLVRCYCYNSRGVIRRVSTTILNPGRVFYKCLNHGKKKDSCDLYFWEAADVGGGWNLVDYSVSRGIPIPAGWDVGQVTKGMTEEEDAEQNVKDVVPLIMAKKHLLNGLESNEEMKDLVEIMGKIIVICRMIVYLFAVYVALVMYSVAMT